MSRRPVRLQLSRAKGFDLQALSLTTNGLPAVNVARPSKWGNPFRIGTTVVERHGEHAMTRAEAVESYRRLVSHMGDKPSDGTVPDLATIKRELRGKNLACWCGDGPCHADILLALANG